jgi:predicted porin
MTSYNVIYSLVSDVGRVYYSLGDYLMKKALLPLLIASALPAAAFADVIVYGKANVSWQSVDKKEFPAQKIGGQYAEVVSNASRIGLKGSEIINDDLKAIYQFEYQAKVDDGTLGNTCSAASTTTAPAKTTTTCKVDGSPFSQRNIYVGIQSNMGTVTAGMFDTPLKLAQEKIDLFNDLVGDLQVVLHGEVRAKNIVQYSTPAYKNIIGNIAYVNSEQQADFSTEGFSASVVYNTKPVYLAIAIDHNAKNASDKAVPQYLGERVDTDIVRLVGRFTLDQFVLGAMYETYDNGIGQDSNIARVEDDPSRDTDGYLLSAQYNINDDWALKVQYGESDMIWEASKTTSLGVDYKLSKAAKVFGYYTKNEDGNLPSDYKATKAIDYTKQKDESFIGVGIELNF